MQLKNEIKSNPMYRYLWVMVILVAIGFQGWRTILNNFAIEEANIDGLKIGIIQSVREIPGFLVFTVVFLLLLFKEHLLAGYMVVMLGIGVALTGLFPSLGGLIVTTLIMSVAFHYYESINRSLTLQTFDKKQAPLVLSKLRSVNSITNIGVGLGILGLAAVLPSTIKYPVMFLTLGGIVVIVMLFVFSRIKVPEPKIPQHKKIILRKKYWLFYVLNFLSGARRQVFVVFAVFLLVEKYAFSIQEITILFVLNNLITWKLNPYIGKWINKFGERKVLSAEYISLILIFLSYAFFENRWIVATLYILDHIFFGFHIAINTYFQKTADPRDIAPSMATGFTINHIMAVVIPVLGGLVWLEDWRIPFLAGAVLSLVSLLFAQKVKTE